MPTFCDQTFLGPSAGHFSGRVSVVMPSPFGPRQRGQSWAKARLVRGSKVRRMNDFLSKRASGKGEVVVSGLANSILRQMGHRLVGARHASPWHRGRGIARPQERPAPCRRGCRGNRVWYLSRLVPGREVECVKAAPSSRGPGHRPFTAVTGVRIPLGTPDISMAYRYWSNSLSKI